MKQERLTSVMAIVTDRNGNESKVYSTTEAYIRVMEEENNPVISEDIVKSKAVNKLGQYEDIDEKLGTDYVTLFKAFTQGIWVKADAYGCCLEYEPRFISAERLELGRELYLQYGEIEFYGVRKLINKEAALCLYTHSYEDTEYTVRVKDQGKTWALTKEELQ